MTTGYLANKMTATPNLQRVAGATSAQLGTTVGTAQAYAAANGTVTCTAIRVFGALFELRADGIYRSIDDGLSWSRVLSFTASLLTGIFVVYDGNGVPRLGAVYAVSTTQTTAVSLTGLTGSWTTAAAPVAITLDITGFPLVFHGSVIWRISATNGAQAITWNVASSTFGSVATGTVSDRSQYLVAWNDVPYMVADVAGGDLRLNSLAGGGFTTAVSIEFVFYNALAAWVDPATNNLVIVGTTNAGVWKAFSITSGPAYAITNRTANMLTGGTLATFSAASKIAGVLYDQDSNPGGAPAIYLLVASSATAGSPVSMFRFNGFGAGAGANLMGVLTTGAPNDSGGAIEFAWPDKNIGGERFYTPRSAGVDGTPEVWNTGKGALGTGVTRRKFKLIAPRSQILTTIGASPATYSLVGTPLAVTPIQSGFTTIQGTIGGVVHTATDQVAPGVLAAPATTTTAVQALPTTPITVADTTNGFPAAGTIVVDSTLGAQTITYTGLTATSFTGCLGGAASTTPAAGFVRGGLLPVPGTIDVGTGALTGTTGTLDAGSQVIGLSNAGTASDQWYRAVAADEYPGSTAAALLTLPTSGALDGPTTTNTGCDANGSEQQISVGMAGFTSGDRITIDPRAL